MPKIDLSETHKQESKDRDFCTLFWKGGRNLIEGKDEKHEDIIIRNSQDKERDRDNDTKDFLARQSLLSNVGIYKKGIVSFEGYVKNAGITRDIEDTIPDNTAQYWDESRETALWLGDWFVGIDSPKTDIKIPTVQQKIDLQLNTRWISIHPNLVPFWRTEKDSWKLTQITIKEENIIEDPFGNMESKVTFIWWTNEKWIRFEEGNDGELREIETGANSFKAVPFVNVKSIFDTVSLCRKQREILFRSKVGLTNTSKTGNTQWKATGLRSHDDVNIDLQQDLITIVGQDGDIDTIGVDAVTMSENREDLQDAKKELARSLFLPVGENVTQSGISKREDKQPLYSTLKKWTSEFSNAENFLGKLGWGESYLATYPSSSADFVVESEDELHDMIEKAIANSMPKAYIDALRKKLASVLDPNIAKEIDFDKAPLLSKSRVEALAIVGDLAPDEDKALYLGLDPKKVAQSVEDGSNRKIASEIAVMQGGFLNNNNDEDNDAA